MHVSSKQPATRPPQSALDQPSSAPATSDLPPSAQPASGESPERRRARGKAPTAAAIAAAAVPTLMTALDNLVMTFALPDIERELGATVTQLQWFVNAYTLVLASALLPMAALGDRFGRRRIFSCESPFLQRLRQLVPSLRRRRRSSSPEQSKGREARRS